jgi:hypothetical protein
MRKLIISFWVFIGIMLAWQFYTYNQSLNQEAVEHPQQEHFFFYNTSAPAMQVNGPNVKQIGYWVEKSTPAQGMLTSHVVLKNVGTAKAVALQVMVRPYRGITIGDADNGMSTAHQLPESDPLSQMGQWIAFPDLAPDESSTQTVVFVARPDFEPGSNPTPEISFTKEQAPAEAPAPTPAPASPANPNHPGGGG